MVLVFLYPHTILRFFSHHHETKREKKSFTVEKICKTFHTTGTCPYGIRCRFIHTRSKEESMMTSVQKVPALPIDLVEEEDVDDDDIVSLNHPPGIPVPQWSKSWNMSLGAMPR